MSWKCEQCQSPNPDRAAACTLCGAPRPASGDRRVCPACRALVSPRGQACPVCGHSFAPAEPAPPASAAAGPGPSFVSPTTPVDTLRRVLELVAGGQAQEGARIATEALSTDRSNEHLHCALGVAYEAMGLADQARACFEQGIRLRPHDALIRLHFARFLRRQPDRPAAIRQLRLAQLTTNDPDVADELVALRADLEHNRAASDEYTRQARTALTMGRTEEAERLARQALALHPENRGGLGALYEACEAQGKIGEALEVCSEFLELFPMNRRMSRMLEQLSERDEWREAGLARVRELIQQAEVLSDASYCEAALGLAEQLCQAEPGKAELLCVLALVQEQLGLYETAVSTYEAALQAEPGHARASARVAALQEEAEALGRQEVYREVVHDLYRAHVAREKDMRQAAHPDRQH